MKKLYLHMGLHKTATSSFQSTCVKNIISLESQGYIYPAFQRDEDQAEDWVEKYGFLHSLSQDRAMYNHGHFLRPLMQVLTHEGNKDEKTNNKYLQLEECLKNTEKNIILSGEGISFLCVSELETLKKIILEFGFEIIPVVCVRSPYEFHCSFMQESIKRNMFEKHDFSQFITQIPKLKTITTCFPQIQFIPFRSASKHTHGFVNFLLEHMGINHENFEVINTNKGLSNVHIRLKREINKIKNNTSKHMLTDNLNYFLSKHKSKFKAKFLLTKDEYKYIKADCERENMFFKDFLGAEFCDEDIKFCNIEDVLQEIAIFFATFQPKLQ